MNIYYAVVLDVRPQVALEVRGCERESAEAGKIQICEASAA